MNMTKTLHETVVTTNDGLQHVTIFIKENDCTSKGDAFAQAIKKAGEFLKSPKLKIWVVTENGYSYLQKNPYRNKHNDYVFLFVEA